MYNAKFKKNCDLAYKKYIYYVFFILYLNAYGENLHQEVESLLRIK